MRDPIAIEAYQRRTVAASREALAAGEDVLMLAPTGAGKTRMTTEVMAGEVAAGGRVVLMHEHRGLAEQSAAVARSRGLDATAWFSGGPGDPRRADVVYTTVDAVEANPAAFGRVTLYGVDEVHHASDERGGQYDRAISGLRTVNPGSRMISTTATERRADGRSLHPLVEAARKVRVTWREVMEAGMIVPTRTRVRPRRLADGSDLQDRARALRDPSDPSASAIGVNGVLRAGRRPDEMDAIAADFVVDSARQQRAAAVAEGRPWTGRVAEKTLAFVDHVKDAEALARALEERGVRAAALHSRMSARDQGRAKAAFAEGRVEALVSIDMVGEGFDAPDTRRVLCAKATTSNLEYRQMVNRVTRAHDDGKAVGLVHDYGASTAMHGSNEVYAAVEAYVSPRPVGAPEPSEANRFKSDWRAWTKSGEGDKAVWGIDLGSRHLFGAWAGEGAMALVEVRKERGTARVANLGTHEPAAVRGIARAAIAEAFRTVVSLGSDVGPDGRTAMERSVREAHARHAGSINVYVAAAKGEVARRRAPAATRPARVVGDRER